MNADESCTYANMLQGRQHGHLELSVCPALLDAARAEPGSRTDGQAADMQPMGVEQLEPGQNVTGWVFMLSDEAVNTAAEDFKCGIRRKGEPTTLSTEVLLVRVYSIGTPLLPFFSFGCD